MKFKLSLNVSTPSSISFMWNWGSLLTLFFFIQILSGIFISFYYTANVMNSFNSVIFLSRNINYGIFFRIFHSNIPSMIFMIMFFHLVKNIMMNSFKFKILWSSGILMLLICMLESFIGYVLPWGQMSFWGATVITNLISIIPFYGNFLCWWIWGNFSVSNSTLTRFFSLHFLFGLFFFFLIAFHFFFLHLKGSSNPLNLSLNLDKISFLNLYLIKDLLLYIFFIIFFMIFINYLPLYLNDEENFIPANPMISPLHIKPEWYFLFSYCILRSIPNKMGGVLGLMFSILIFFFFIFFKKKNKSIKNFFLKKIFINFLIHYLIIMSWIGMNSVFEPFIFLGKIYSFFYFFIFLFIFKFFEII